MDGETAPRAEIHYIGQIEKVDSNIPVRLVNDDTLEAETWLDGRLTDYAVLPPEGDRNMTALVEGRFNITPRIRANDMHQIRAFYYGISERGWYDVPGADLFCHMPDCTERATWINETVIVKGHRIGPGEMAAGQLCVEHFALWRTLRDAGTLQPRWVKSGDADLDHVMATVCARCTNSWGEHFGEKCPDIGGQFILREEIIGYDADGNPLVLDEVDMVAMDRNRQPVTDPVGYAQMARDGRMEITPTARPAFIIEQDGPNRITWVANQEFTPLQPLEQVLTRIQDEIEEGDVWEEVAADGLDNDPAA